MNSFETAMEISVTPEASADLDALVGQQQQQQPAGPGPAVPAVPDLRRSDLAY